MHTEKHCSDYTRDKGALSYGDAAHLVEPQVVLELQQYALILIQKLPDRTTNATNLHMSGDSR